MSHERTHGRVAGMCGASLIEALIAFAVLSFSALALVHLQAAAMAAQDDARQWRDASRWMHNSLERWRAGEPAATSPGAAQALIARQPPRLALQASDQPVGVQQGANREVHAAWVADLQTRSGEPWRWSMVSHRYLIDAQAYRGSGMETLADEAAWFAPAARPPSMDRGFGIPDPPAAPAALTAGRPPLLPSLPWTAAAASGPPRCTQEDLERALTGLPPTARCDPRRLPSRSGSVRWSSAIDTMPALQQARADWLAMVLQAPRARPPQAGHPLCAYALASLGSAELVWRCLGDPAASADARQQSADVGRWIGIDPFTGLPPMLGLCRVAGDEAQHAWSLHERIHVLVVASFEPCPFEMVHVRF